MRILLVADKVAPQLYEHFNREQIGHIDFILSAGDLKADYLSYLTTIMKVPLLYIHGNHDHRYLDNPPMGCVDIEDTIYEIGGLKILGLGGCMEYRGGPFQYTEKAMNKRIKKIKRKLKGGFDILLTHSPAYELGDGKDTAHIGFKCFKDLLETYKPSYMLHGHQHLNYGNYERCLEYDQTKIINGYGYYILEI